MSDLYYYEPDYNRFTCYTYYNFIKTVMLLQTKGEKILLNESIYHTPYTLKYEGGGVKPYYSWPYFFEAMKDELGIDVDLLSLGNTCDNCNIFRVALTTPMKEQIRKGEIFRDVPSISDTTPVIPTITPVSMPEVESVETVIPEETVAAVDSPKEEALPESTTEVDYDELREIWDEESVSKSKNALQKKVVSKYNIRLRKNQTFEEMIGQLKEEL